MSDAIAFFQARTALAPFKPRKLIRLLGASAPLTLVTASGLVIGLLFALYPYWDVVIASWFFDPRLGQFPFALDSEWRLARRIANWVPFLLLIPPVLVLVGRHWANAAGIIADVRLCAQFLAGDLPALR